MELAVGARLQACDRVGNWYPADVVAERGEGELREVQVHFLGFSKSQDEWIGAASGKLVPLGQETPDTYLVERILRKRRRGGRVEYFVRWEGYGTEDDSWEPADNVSDDLIEDFETADAREEGSGVQHLAQPYVLSLPFPLDDSMADVLAAEWVDGIGRKGAALLGHQRDECGRLSASSQCRRARPRSLSPFTVPSASVEVRHACRSTPLAPAVTLVVLTVARRRLGRRDGIGHLFREGRAGRQVRGGPVRRGRVGSGR